MSSIVMMQLGGFVMFRAVMQLFFPWMRLS